MTVALIENRPQCSFNEIILKGALDKYNIIPQLSPKKLGFYTIRSVGMGNDRVLSFTF